MNPQSVCQLALLSLFCVLMTVSESDSTFVPGRCMCPQTQPGVRGKLKELTVHPKSPHCEKITVIVTLSNNRQVCLNPEAPMGTQLIRCWNRANREGRDVNLCLKRKRARGGRRQRLQKRRRNHSQNVESSGSQ